MDDQIFIQHRFKKLVEVNGISQIFEDAITLPQEQYDALTENAIEEEKQRRISDFIQTIETPPSEEEGNE